jgi:sugar lactone lactonase YvrE
MRTSLRLLSNLVVLFFLAVSSITTFAAVHTSATPTVRVTKSVDNGKRTTLYGHTPKAVRRGMDLGRITPSTPAEHLIILLKSSQDQEREARRVIDEQHDKRSANYHRWVSPEEFGAHFGVHDSDIESVKNWLSGQGFVVEEVTKAKRAIRFTGTVGQIEQAFQTEMHFFLMSNGETHVSNDRDISIPEALSPVIAGVPTLNDFFRKSHRVEVGRMSRMRPGPKFSNGTNCGSVANSDCFVGPADFATIYNTTPLLASGINGAGITIGIVGRSDILMSDVQTYRQMFNLPVNDPVFIHAGQDNGINAGDDGESDLDVEISGGIAPAAKVDFVIGTPTFLVDGITNSIQYLVENNNVDIISTSYGDCESNEGAGGNAFNSQMFEQAAAQGISVFVADGDNGPAECDDSNDSFEALGYAASAEGSTPYAVSVGGTEFDEGTNTGYWSNTNNPLNLSSAVSYIPEYPWNEAKSASPTSTPSGDLSGLWSGSGGISAYYLQPPWQYGSGVPTTDPVLTQGGNWITVNITNAGSGYTAGSTPSVTFSGETCASNPQSGATAIVGTGAQAGQIVGITYNNGSQGGTVRTGQGFGCTVPGTVTFGAAPAGGTTATGTVVLAPMQNMLPLIPGVPHRYTPDLSLNAAADHDGTLFCSEGVCEISSTGALLDAGIVGGTSVAAPSMAGIQALIDQANGGRQGMPAYIYYILANNQYVSNPGACNSSGPPASNANCAFQDITTGNNLICGTSSCTTSPAKIGFQAGTGYDLATGLGSVNAANLSGQWSSVVFNSSNTNLNLSQTTFAHGTPITLSGTVAPGSSGTPTGDVAFIVSSGAIGDTVNPNTGGLNGPVAYATLSGGSYSASLNNLPGGTYYVTARYGGDENFASSYSASTQVTVSSEGSSFTLTASSPNATTTCSLTNPSSYSYGANILIDAQVTSASGAGAATGTVTILDNGNPIATNLTLDPNGHAFLLSGPIGSTSCLYQYNFSNTSTFTVGTHNLTATYSGDVSLNSTTAGPLGVVVTPATPTLTLATGATQITSGFAVPLTATFGVTAISGGSIGSLAPTGTVTFTDTTTSAVLGTAPVVSTSVTTINAQTTTFTAVAGPLTTNGVTQTGANLITATYSGDTNWAGITSSAVTVTVGTFTTATTTMVTNAGTGTLGNPSTLGARPTFTATIGVASGTAPTTGTVTFYDTTTTNNLNNLPAGTYVLGTGNLGSTHTATFRLATTTEFGGGTHSITATYGGVATTFSPSSSSAYSETVTQGTVTNVLTAKTVGKSGQAYYFTSVITPSSTSTSFQPTANVQFFDACANCSPSYGATSLGTAALYSISSGNGGYGIYEANLSANSLPAGSHTITATYLGDVNYPATTSAAQTVFAGGTPTVSWTTPAPITYGTALTAAQLNATANIPGTFAYSPTAGTVLNAGSQPLSVTFTPSDYIDFAPQNAGITLVVNQVSQTITFTTSPPSSAAYQSSFSVAATGGASGNPVVFSSGGSCSNVGALYTMTSGSGACSVIANQAGTTNYAPATLTLTVNATQISQIITFSTNAPSSAAYASSFSVAATASSGDPVAFTSSGSCSNSGASYTMTSGAGACSVIANQAGDSNYAPAPPVTQTTNALPASSGTLLTSLDSNIYSSQSTTLTATVSAAGGSAPSGTVSFMLGATVLGTNGLVPTGPASSATSVTLSASQLAVGPNTIFAVYSGDVNFLTSTSPNISVTLTQPQANLGSVQVGSPSSTVGLEYQFSADTTLSAINILTEGVSGLDYADGGSSTCVTGTLYSAGSSCTVSVSFTPSAPGARAGAVTLFAHDQTLPLMTWYLSGVGDSAAVTIDPGTLTTTTLTGTLAPAGYGSAVDGAGNVYVVDHANNAVLKLAAGTFTQTTAVAGLSGPTGVALDGAGNLYISNGSSVVKVPNENGTLNPADQSTVTLTGLGSARGVAVDAMGSLYVGDATNNDVVELSNLGVQTTIASGLTSPHGVAVDAGGNVYVATNNAVTQYPLGGGTPVPYGTGYNNPRGLAVDAAGAVYVADTGNNQIVRVAPGGAAQTSLAISGLSSPQGVAVDSADNLYVTDPSIVIQVNRTQAAALSFPSTSVGSTSAAQVVTVSDAGNQQLQISNIAVSANFVQQPSGGSDCNSGGTLNVGLQCEIGVAFAPTQSGSLTGTLTLTDNALNNSSSSQSVQLSGGGAKVGQSITFTTNAPASAAYNSSFTVAATASSGLAVAFTSSGACSNLGATYTMTSGTGSCTVIANQSGNGEYLAAPQLTQSTAATKSSQSITFTTNAPSFAPYQSSFTVAATASSGDPVVFTSSGVCTNAGATYTMTAASGTCTVIANQSGDSNYSAAPQVTQSVTADKAAPLVTFTGAPPSAPYQATFTVMATSNSGVTPTIAAAGACSISGTAVTMISGTGTCTVTAKWAANADYLATSVTQSTTAQKLVSTVTWSTPSPITYGTALSATQLDATANVAGSFAYSPAAGSVPKAGTHTLLVNFTPTLNKDYTTASASVTLQVNQATPIITWATPAPIAYGTPLSGTQLDATANVPGSFSYSPKSGTVPKAGSQTLSVTFSPTDHTDYVTATDSVTLVVNQVSTTTTITSNLPNPSKTGKPVSVHFTVTPATSYSPPTGKVTVSASTGETCSGTLAGGSGACSLIFTTTGSRTLSATYAGDSNNSGSSSVTVTQTVN